MASAPARTDSMRENPPDHASKRTRVEFQKLPDVPVHAADL